MPRRSKPAGGGQPNGQPVQVATGQEYGAATQQREAQQQVPLHQAPAPVDPMAAAAQAAAPVPFEMGLLRAPTEAPDEPLTAGLTAGPGAGPESLVMQHAAAGRTSSTLEQIATATGDPFFAALAQRARARGL